MNIDDLVNLDAAELQAALADWKRWRNHVRHAPVMRLRQERFEQACAFITAIEAELALRVPQGRYRRYREAMAAVRALRDEAIVSLSDYRFARRDLEAIASRMSGVR